MRCPIDRVSTNMIRIMAFLLMTGLLAACGGGGGGGGTSPPPVSPSLSYPSGTQLFVVGTPTTVVTPTITGTLSNFTASPKLPAGLGLDAQGVIRGSPLAAAAAASYAISASTSSGGTISATVSIAVNDIPPSNISYGASTTLAFSAQIASKTIGATSTGGVVVSWSINPALPAGLNFSTTDGSISGTPSAPSATATYVVTAQNTGGQSTTSLQITVGPGPIVDLGHQTQVQAVRASATRLLSQDQSGYWYLWDYSAATAIASGVGASIDMAGSTVVVQTSTGLEVRAASDGHILGTIATTLKWWALASDGSYVTAGNQQALSAWTPTGQLLFSEAGDYSNAVAFATPGATLVAMSPAGANVVQTITVPTGTVGVSPPFTGAFSSWFTDGSGFITTVGGVSAFIYSASGVQERGFANLAGATVGGRDSWVWTFPNPAATGQTLNIYPASGSGAPAASFPLSSLATVYPSGNTLGVVDASNPKAISVIDLSAATPSKTDYTAPLPLLTDSPIVGSPYAAVSASQWIMGNQYGVLLDGASIGSTPRYFGYGQALSIAGGTSYFAIATASGPILYFDSNTLALLGKLNFTAGKLALSSDGTVLAAVGGLAINTGSVNIYALPTGNLQYSWPAAQDIALSGSGTVLAQDVWSNLTYTQEAGATTGGSLAFSTTFSSHGGIFPPPLIRLSPDGSLVITSQEGEPPGAINGVQPTVVSNLWHNGTLVTALPGLPVGWLDDNRVVVNQFVYQTSSVSYTCVLYDATGTPTGAPCALPEALLRFQPISSDLVYNPDANQILSVSTGKVNWVSADPWSNSSGNPYYAAAGAVAGTNIIFVSGTGVVAQPY